MNKLTGVCSIIASLAGTSYYGPVAGHGIETHELFEMRERRKRKTSESEGETKGDIEALPADEAGNTAEGYVVLKKHEEPEETGGDKTAEGEEKAEGKDSKEEKEEAKDEQTSKDEQKSKDGKQ